MYVAVEVVAVAGSVGRNTTEYGKSGLMEVGGDEFIDPKRWWALVTAAGATKATTRYICVDQ